MILQLIFHVRQILGKICEHEFTFGKVLVCFVDDFFGCESDGKIGGAIFWKNPVTRRFLSCNQILNITFEYIVTNCNFSNLIIM